MQELCWCYDANAVATATDAMNATTAAMILFCCGWDNIASTATATATDTTV